MEHVINAKLRNQAFWKFMIFFVVTVLIVITAVYFDYDLPNKENALLRGKINDYETQSDNQQQFIANMEAAKNLIDSMVKSGEYDVFTVNKVVKYFDNLRDSKHVDSTIYAIMNNEVFSMLQDYNNLSKNYIASKDAKERADSLAKQVEEWKEKYNVVYTRLLALGRSNGTDF